MVRGLVGNCVEISMSRFFTADQHFGHANILKFQPENRVDGRGRPFKSVEHMGDCLVEYWNESIGDEDEVYCLGDFCFKQSVMQEIVPRLRGRKILICGNHDPFFKRVVNGRIEEARQLAREIGFAELHMDLVIEMPGIGKVRMHHFPYVPADTSELKDYELRYLHLRPVAGDEKFLLHGHVHSEWREHRYTGLPWMMNVGVDLWGMRPVPEAVVVEYLRYNL